MALSASTVGLMVIITLYFGIGVMSAAGSTYISKALLTPKLEQIVFALFLVPIAGFYLAFTAYFGRDGAWRLEWEAVVAFTVIALVGVRVPIALIIGYPLHGIWDVLHELHAHGGGDVFGAREATAIPLAYGVFCTTYDLCMGVYFYTRRGQWRAAWAPPGTVERLIGGMDCTDCNL